MSGNWKWRVVGTERPSASWSSSGPNGVDESGVREAEHSAEVLLWLPVASDVWELLDPCEPITVTIEPAEERP